MLSQQDHWGAPFLALVLRQGRHRQIVSREEGRGTGASLAKMA